MTRPDHTIPLPDWAKGRTIRPAPAYIIREQEALDRETQCSTGEALYLVAGAVAAVAVVAAVLS